MTTATQDTLHSAKTAVKDAVKDTAGKVKDNVQDSTQEISNLLSDLKDLLSTQSFSSQPEFAKFKQRLEQGVAELREHVSEVAQESTRQLRNAGQKVNTYAHDQPWQLAGAALAIGTLAGILIARRH